MNKIIQEPHELIVEIGRSGDVVKLALKEIADYHDLANELLANPLPSGIKNRRDFIKGMVLLENSLHLGSTSRIWKFMQRLDLYTDIDLMDWIFAHRNNPYIPFGKGAPSLEVQSYSQYLNYEKERQTHHEKMLALDMERSRLAKERKDRIREEHEARKKANDEKRSKQK